MISYVIAPSILIIPTLGNKIAANLNTHVLTAHGVIVLLFYDCHLFSVFRHKLKIYETKLMS